MVSSVESLPLPKEAKEAVYEALQETVRDYIEGKFYSKAKAVINFMEGVSDESEVKGSFLPPPPLGGKEVVKNTAAIVTDEEVNTFMEMLVSVIEEADYFNLNGKYTTFQFQQAVAGQFDVSDYDIELPNGPGQTRYKWKVLVSQAISRLVNRGLLVKESRYYYTLSDYYINRIKCKRQESQVKVEPIVDPLPAKLEELSFNLPNVSTETAGASANDNGAWPEGAYNKKPTIYRLDD